MSPTRPWYLCLLASSALLCACDRVIDDRVEVVRERALRDDLDRKPKLDADNSARFPIASRAATAGPLIWKAPPSWTRVTDNSMRIADYRIGAAGDAECYLSHLPGAAGGVEANVNRWRKQLGLEAVDSAQIAKLGKIPMFGGQATFVDFSGSYQGMRDPEPKPGSRMLGAILELGEMSLFVKMVGPEKLVGEERDRFIAFCESIQFNREAPPAGE